MLWAAAGGRGGGASVAAVAGPAGQLGDALDDELGVEDAEHPGQLDGDLVLRGAVLDPGDDGGGLVEGGAAARGVSRSYRPTIWRSANSKSGVRGSTRSRTASSPLTSRRSQGSMLSGAIAMYVSAANFWSSSKARRAAFW